MSSLLYTKKGGNAPAILLAFALFYFPTAFSIFSHNGGPGNWTMISVIIATLYALMFCVNYFWLVPRMLVRSEKQTLYFIINFLLIIGLCTIMQLLMHRFHHLPPDKRHIHKIEPTFLHYLMDYLRFVFRDGVMMVLSAALAYAMRLSKERENVRQRELELNAEQRQIELQSLKAQLNPHFLFNSINNIYALIGFAPERAQQALHDLSGMLRFMIYDSVTAYVPLYKEFQFITDYVELVKLRLSQAIKVSCKVPHQEDSNLYVAPLLFLTIVENAFKHCSQSEAGYFIDINIHKTAESLVCSVKNSVGSDHIKEGTLPKESGIGLDNVKRQLNLIYPGSYAITLQKNNGVYYAEISISLHALKKHDAPLN
ncbi:MAG: histidine kinase [Bacteroides sp.]|nr:histidine kinase [Bacteroides sp.]